MSYTALYRKWRPDTFEEIKGQDAIVTTLRNQIDANRIGHAYLFCGTRGTGKTTAAKVFAKAVNCENPVNGSPCGNCASCRSIAAGNSMNVIEMDAASNNGVDTIRELREDVVYSPTEGKYKVYIIDEAHMITTAAFNAFLKTLEEPPSYVIFILATTDPQKIPVTILSRCQRYDFKRISTDVIADRLKEVIKAENISIDDKAVGYIARTADGGMRDALSLLDRCESFFLGKDITYDRALDLLGAVDTAVFSEFLRCLIARNVTDAIHLIDRIVVQGRDIDQFVNDFIWYLRNIMIAQASDEANEIIDITSDNLAFLKKEAEAISSDRILRLIRLFSELSASMKYASQKRVLLEITIVKVCKPEMETNYDSLVDRIKAIEEMIESGELSSSRAAGQDEGAEEDPSVKSYEKEQIEEAKNLPEATREELLRIAGQWKSIVHELAGQYYAVFKMCEPSVRPSDGRLVIKFENETVKTICDTDECRKDLDEAFAKIFGKKVEYEFAVAGSGTDGRKGTYYPPLSMFGMPLTVDDTEFENDKY